MNSFPSIPYPPSRQGFWGETTATLNFCEEDYYATIYSAEIVNTLTNMIFLWLACKGIANCIANGHETVFLVSFIGYSVVGTGSILFHSTIKYPMQLVDELSMIYTTCLMVFATFSFGRSTTFCVWMGLALVALAVSITGYYHYLQDPRFHQTAYAILTAVVVFHSMYVMERALRPYLRRGQKDRTGSKTGKELRGISKTEEDRRDARDTKILTNMWTMIAYGLGIFLGGFAIWNLDNAYCSRLIEWRHSVGLPWGVLSEGHGWWHLMTGIGAYYYIMWGIWLRHCLNGRQDEFELHWPRLITSFPVVVRRKSREAGNVPNGDAKKTS